jgi:riboflavin synthase
MFSGIVEEVGRVERIGRSARELTLQIGCVTVLNGTRIGDSIAVDGVCLTVTSLGESGFTASIQPITARLTNLDGKRSGDRVNLERSVVVGGRIGGHYVQGHVDGVGRLVGKRDDGASVMINIDAPDRVCRYIVERGFIAVDGASLTVMSKTSRGFAVSLVSHTQQHITLSRLPLGAPVNLEVDVIAKYVEQLVSPFESDGVTMDALQRAGYM